MTRSTTLSLPKLIAGIAVFVLVGFPLVGYLWETLNELLAGIVDLSRLAIALPILLAFAAVLTILSRTVRRWEAERLEEIQPTPRRQRHAL